MSDKELEQYFNDKHKAIVEQHPLWYSEVWEGRR